MDKPYKLNNKWVLDVYFKSSNIIKKVTLDWASAQFLAFGRYYKNGMLNNSGIRKNAKIIDVDLSNIDFNLVEDFLELENEGITKKIRTNIFVGFKDGVEYRVPALEVIRAVIATNRFLLNRVVEMDSLNKYFVFNFDDKKNLYIDFFDEYERKLLKSEYVKHLAWIISNKNILKMFNQIGKNLWLEGNIRFQFLFKKFNIKARITRKQNVLRILEITEFRDKKINANEIYISSKYLNHIKRINRAKQRKYKNLKENEGKILDPKIDGAMNIESDFINTFKAKHVYSKDSKINRLRNGTRYIGKKEDETTKIYEVENENLRTTEDVGGLDRARALEYKNIDDIQIKGELEEFVEILKLLEKKTNIKNVKSLIDYLPKGKKGKKFSKLSDGKTRRRYAVGMITMADDRNCSLIEIEREEKSLSMMLLYSNRKIMWNSVILAITLGLVNKNGTWDSKGLERYKSQGIFSERLRHKNAKSSIVDKADYIFYKLK